MPVRCMQAKQANFYIVLVYWSSQELIGFLSPFAEEIKTQAWPMNCFFHLDLSNQHLKNLPLIILPTSNTQPFCASFQKLPFCIYLCKLQNSWNFQAKLSALYGRIPKACTLATMIALAMVQENDSSCHNHGLAGWWILLRGSLPFKNSRVPLPCFLEKEMTLQNTQRKALKSKTTPGSHVYSSNRSIFQPRWSIPLQAKGSFYSFYRLMMEGHNTPFMILSKTQLDH